MSIERLTVVYGNMVRKRCDHNLRPIPCLRVFDRWTVGQGRHNANNDSNPDGKTSKRSDGSAGYCLKSRVKGSLEGECVCVQALYLLSDPKKTIHTTNRPQAITVDLHLTINQYLAITVDFCQTISRPQVITVDLYHMTNRPEGN